MALITEQDRNYMKAFPARKKTEIIRQIMSRSPAEESNLEGNTTCDKTILKLRARGLELIDLQALEMETAVTTVWYGKNTSILGQVRSEVAALLLWEYKPDDEDVTTVRVWHF
ncbi:MAG: hypothetical protein A3G24_23735 [Betaproteobacteria bacterium RIFCSPLOWO2_12_FULL_62_13]|nr:MAG: hypothetical protein A3G24_23735 [Betaproteobacteria bacterium RIFCSPLOWO2_12_FULL_62_13]